MNNIKIAKQLVRIAKNLVGGVKFFKQQFPQKTTYKQMKQMIDDNMSDVYDIGAPYTRLKSSNLELFDKIFQSKEEAQNFLIDYAQHHHDCGARFKQPIKNTDDEEEFYKVIKEEDKKLLDIFFQQTAECPVCKSIINLKLDRSYRGDRFKEDGFIKCNDYGQFYIDKYLCPVCIQGDLMDSVLKKNHNAKKIINKIETMIKEKKQKQKQNQFEIKWFVVAARHY